VLPTGIPDPVAAGYCPPGTEAGGETVPPPAPASEAPAAPEPEPLTPEPLIPEPERQPQADAGSTESGTAGVTTVSGDAFGDAIPVRPSSPLDHARSIRGGVH
jgi:hypothetical protein